MKFTVLFVDDTVKTFIEDCFPYVDYRIEVGLLKFILSKQCKNLSFLEPDKPVGPFLESMYVLRV